MRKAALVLALTLGSVPALAQSPPPIPPGTAPLGPAAGAPSAAPVTVPPPPEVNDPMLAPVPQPPRVIGSWHEAVSLLRARSTDLKTAVDEVLQAEAQTRIALAQYLPTITGQGTYIHQLITRPVTGLSINAATGSAVPTTRAPIPNITTGSIQLTQDIINVQEFDQISINELGE